MVVALETDLVSRAQAGDRGAFGQLYDTYLPKIYDFALGMTRSKADAEDVTSETFLKAVEKLGSLKEPDAFRGWLYTIARNAALSLIDGRKRAVPTAEHDEYASAHDVATLPDPEMRIESDELRDLVWDAAATLNPRDFQVFELTVRHGLSSAEIAPMLGVRPAYAYILVNRLKDSVAEALETVLLTRTGRSDCAELDSLIAKYGETPTPKMRKAITRHAKDCEACGETKKSKASVPAILAGMAFASPGAAFASELASKIDAAWPPAPGGGPGSDGSSGGSDGGAAPGGKLAHLVGAASIVAVIAATTITAGAQRTIHEVEAPDTVPVAEQTEQQETEVEATEETPEPDAPVVRRPATPAPQPRSTPTVVIVNSGDDGTVNEGETNDGDDDVQTFPPRPEPTEQPGDVNKTPTPGQSDPTVG